MSCKGVVGHHIDRCIVSASTKFSINFVESGSHPMKHDGYSLSYLFAEITVHKYTTLSKGVVYTTTSLSKSIRPSIYCRNYHT